MHAGAKTPNKVRSKELRADPYPNIQYSVSCPRLTSHFPCLEKTGGSLERLEPKATRLTHLRDCETGEAVTELGGARTALSAGRQGASSEVNTDRGRRSRTHTQRLVYTWLLRLCISGQIEREGREKKASGENKSHQKGIKSQCFSWSD